MATIPGPDPDTPPPIPDKPAKEPPREPEREDPPEEPDWKPEKWTPEKRRNRGGGRCRSRGTGPERGSGVFIGLPGSPSTRLIPNRPDQASCMPHGAGMRMPSCSGGTRAP